MNLITQLKTPNDLEQLLKANTGLVLIKLGATWCGPFKKIEPLIMQWYEKFNHEKITRIVLDIDEKDIEFYRNKGALILDTVVQYEHRDKIIEKPVYKDKIIE